MPRNPNKPKPWSRMTEDERRIVLAAMGLDRKGPQARESRELERKLAESNAEYERIRIGKDYKVTRIND